MSRKYLRYLQIVGVKGNSFANHTFDDPELAAAVESARRPCLTWMYEHHALPLATNGIGKVNVMFTRSSPNPLPEVIPNTPEDREGEGIAEVFESFDLAHFQTLDPSGQDRFLLESFHAALLRCARSFGWDTQPLEEARSRILADNFRLSFFWKKPVSSPDRRTKVQPFIEASDQATIHLVFFDRQMRELRRALLCTAQPRSGFGEFELHRIRWLDASTVKIEQKNGRDYWLCDVNGEPEFHYPRAEQGDAHGQYQLGRMYLSGEYVRADRERGLELIRSAAAQGYAHAVGALAREGAGQ